jgi:hypothetical protein
MDDVQTRQYEAAHQQEPAYRKQTEQRDDHQPGNNQREPEEKINHCVCLLNGSRYLFNHNTAAMVNALRPDMRF